MTSTVVSPHQSPLTVAELVQRQVDDCVEHWPQPYGRNLLRDDTEYVLKAPRQPETAHSIASVIIGEIIYTDRC